MHRVDDGLFSRVSIAFLAFAAGLIGSACAKKIDDSVATETRKVAPAISVQQSLAKTVTVPVELSLSGSLIGAEEAEVAAGSAGKVLATHVERGAVVKRGALLVRLDGRAIGAQAQEATAHLESLRVQAAQAQLDCQRNEQMFGKGAISKADYDRSRTQCETTKWSVSAAEARKTLTSEALRDTEIRAPFNGMVVERFVSAGEYVRPDSRVVTLVAVDSLRIELTVPESEIARVKQDMSIEFRPAAVVDGKTYHGRIRYVGPSVRKQTRDGVVEAIVDNAGHDLRPGMFVTASLALGEQTVPAVPESAVVADGTLRHVFVVVDGRLEDRIVQVQAPRDGLVPILRGIKAGDAVVTVITPEVRDGARVN
jgi:membrane fusion protein, multidrug efflux system